MIPSRDNPAGKWVVALDVPEAHYSVARSFGLRHRRAPLRLREGGSCTFCTLPGQGDPQSSQVDTWEKSGRQGLPRKPE